MLKQFTSKLFYKKYVYKLRVNTQLASIFREMNLTFAKKQLDEMQRLAEADVAIIIPGRWGLRKTPPTISLEDFMDACVIYTTLQENRKHCMVRCEGTNLDIYSNQKDWLLNLTNRINVHSFYEPYDQEVLNFLLDNSNVEIVDKEVEWVYKAYLGNYIDPNFADFCLANSKNVRIGKRALSSVKNSYYCNGFYFFTKTEKFLMLAKIAAGGDITRIIKYVNRKDLNK